MEVGTMNPRKTLVLGRVDPGWPFAEKAKELITLYYEKYKVIGIGGTRVAFDIGDGLVAKIPLFDNDYNISEAKKSRDSNSSGKRDLAQACAIDEEGVIILLMEKVTPIKDINDIPYDRQQWARKFDCSQVGWTSDGRLVAYDFA